jgi:hypothetical protein
VTVASQWASIGSLHTGVLARSEVYSQVEEFEAAIGNAQVALTLARASSKTGKAKALPSTTLAGRTTVSPDSMKPPIRERPIRHHAK